MLHSYAFCYQYVFTQGVEETFSFEMDNVASKAAIGPGKYIEYSPSISNVGNISGYVSALKFDNLSL